MDAQNDGTGTPVLLNVYDLTPVNDYLYWLGFGVFHSGIEGIGSLFATSLCFFQRILPCPWFCPPVSMGTAADLIEMTAISSSRQTIGNGAILNNFDITLAVLGSDLL
jgi:hypothetical protein